MSEFDLPEAGSPVPAYVTVETPVESATPMPVEQPTASGKVADPARSAASRLGGKRAHKLAELGLKYEQEYGLKPGRQRLKQLAQFGRRYEQEHGLRPKPVKRRRRTCAEAWEEFGTALSRVVKPAHRAAVEKLAAALKSEA